MQYILFDLDGTLINTKEGVVKSVYYALDSLGITEDEPEKLERFVGPPLKDSFMNFYQLNERGAERAIEKFRERYKEKGMYECRIFEGIEELLHSLKEQGKILCVATSKAEPFVSNMLKNAGIYHFFDFISAASLDGSIVHKPDIIKQVLNNYTDASKTDMVMVGDTKFDIIGAKEVGLKNIAVEYGFAAKGELEQAEPDVMVATVEELSEILLREG